MKKYIVTGDFSDLGQVFDRREDAVEWGKIHDRRIDEMTGYSKAFGHVSYNYHVTKVNYREVTPAEYLRAVKIYENYKKLIEHQYKRRLRIYTRKYTETMLLYQNQAGYNMWDEIEMVIRPVGAKRNKKIVGVVCGLYVTDAGEQRPTLRGQTYPQDAEILSIKLLRKESQVTLHWGGTSPAREF